MCKQYILPGLSRLHFVRLIRYFRCVLRSELALSKEAEKPNVLDYIIALTRLCVNQIMRLFRVFGTGPTFRHCPELGW